MYENWKEEQLREELIKLNEILLGDNDTESLSESVQTFMHDSYLDMADDNNNVVPLLIQLDTILNMDNGNTFYEEEDEL